MDIIFTKEMENSDITTILKSFQGRNPRTSNFWKCVIVRINREYKYLLTKEVIDSWNDVYFLKSKDWSQCSTRIEKVVHVLDHLLDIYYQRIPFATDRDYQLIMGKLNEILPLTVTYG